MKRTLITTLCGIVSLALASPLPSALKGSPKTMNNAKATIVLVHGAFADANCWSKIIPALEKSGHNVIAVQNALTSLEHDAATTRRVIDAQKGPVIVVGHSYGGAVMTTAAVGAENVKGLVYIAAFAPDEGEIVQQLLGQYPSKLATSLVPDTAGFLYIDRAKFKDAFAGDVSDTERTVMETTQKPVNSTILGYKFTAPAWKSFPTWYMVASEDNAINPDLERMFAKRMNAKTIEIKSSHVPMISKPNEVIKLIEAAVSASVK
jgi:pimeloyl-ACP methyl ester carboxylesterase